MTARTPDKPERPKTLGRAVHEKYPAAVVEPRDAYRDELTHVDEHGDVRMVDVGEKAVTQRLAIAEGSILMHPETQAMILEDRAKRATSSPARASPASWRASARATSSPCVTRSTSPRRRSR